MMLTSVYKDLKGAIRDAGSIQDDVLPDVGPFASFERPGAPAY